MTKEYPLHEDAALVFDPTLTKAVTLALRKTGVLDYGDPETMSEPETATTYADPRLLYDTLSSLEIDSLIYCNEFEGTASPLLDNENGERDMDFDDWLIYLSCDKEADLFRAAYAGIDELTEEFRTKLLDVGIDLGDFPLEKHICSITGTYLC